MVTIPAEIIKAAQDAQHAWNVPSSVSIAQWAFESGYGLHSPGNNPFGIKALPGQPSQNLKTTEVIHDQVVHEFQPFAVFSSIDAAFEAHAKLIATKPVYAPAMAALPDLERFVPLLAAHYATDKLYASKITNMIVQRDLTQYDQGHPA